MAKRYFEDFKVGERIETAGATLTESHMIDFALRYDPQPFHLDSVAAKDSIYGGIIASGFLTLAMSFRLFMQTGALGDANLGGPGFEEVKFLKPVRPGDTLRVVVEIVDARASQSKQDRGILTVRATTYNQSNEAVLSYTCPHLLKRRPR
ncbi:MAG TPA: MaoC family dehydratase [Alphaproteobacteria bacterium]|nr:MaoC family dehydratase [Alphaproteobacteria bacterium]